jgi:TupA-like ATPgrasp
VNTSAQYRSGLFRTLGIRDPIADIVSTQKGMIAARTRIALTYAWRHRRLPRIDSPVTFTDWVQHRKLTDRNLLMPPFADKVRAKALVAAELGDDWIIPTFWHGSHLPAVPEWPLPLVVKSRHGCNQCAFIRTGAEDWAAIRRRARRWVGSTYGGWLDEWLYSQITPGVLVEPFVGIDGKLPVDYKFYVFGGRVEFVQVHIDRERHHRWIILDRNWRRVSSPTIDEDPQMPYSLPAMIEAAEMLGKAFDFVRADFYDISGRPLFGEMTFYPGSGLDAFDPVALDTRMGKLWQTAQLQPNLSRSG